MLTVRKNKGDSGLQLSRDGNWGVGLQAGMA